MMRDPKTDPIPAPETINKCLKNWEENPDTIPQISTISRGAGVNVSGGIINGEGTTLMNKALVSQSTKKLKRKSAHETDRFSTN